MVSCARVTGDSTIQLLGETITNHTIMCYLCMSENDDNHQNNALWTQMMSINCILKSGIAPIKPKPLHLISLVLISRKMRIFRFEANSQLSLMTEYSENSQERWKCKNKIGMNDRSDYDLLNFRSKIIHAKRIKFQNIKEIEQ